MSYQAANAISQGRVTTILRDFSTDLIPVNLVHQSHQSHQSHRAQPLRRCAFLDFVRPRLNLALAKVSALPGCA
jgi:hypothetical protein